MSMKMIASLLGIAFLLAGSAIAAEPTAEIVNVQKIWDKAPHNAFTDITRYKDAWYCVFREGKGHVSPHGALRVITSKDGKTWESAALLTSDISDLRDAKITVTPDNRLMLCGAGALLDKTKGSHQSYIWYSENGTDWGEAIPIGDRGYWIWRITWHDGIAYGVGYRTDNGRERGTRLYRSEDGKNFEVWVPSLRSENSPNESSLLFLEDDTAYCLSRREGPDKTAILGTSQPPYKEWTWKDLNVQIGGPQLLQLEDGRIVVGGRGYPGGAKTKLWWLDPKSAELTEITTLPSGGDTSYPGLFQYDGLLWVSYYSSHEGKTSIYLAKVDLPPAK